MGSPRVNACQADFDERVVIVDFDQVSNKDGRDMAVQAVRVEIPESFLNVAGTLVDALRSAGADCATYWMGFAAMPLVRGQEGRLCPTSDFGDADEDHGGSCAVRVNQDGSVDISMWSFDDNMEFGCRLGTVEGLHAKFEVYNKGLSTPKMRG
jgi:hypothetical protein